MDLVKVMVQGRATSKINGGIMEYPQEFENLWAIYPKRNGNNPKRKAYNAYKARIRQKYTYEELINGVKLYKIYCEVSRIIKTSFIMHMSTFLGPDENFLEDWEPPQPERKNESVEDKGKRLNIVARIGESMADYEKRILQAR